MIFFYVLKIVYGSLPKTSNALNIRPPKIIAKINFKMFPKISDSGLFSEIEFLKFQTTSFFAPKKSFSSLLFFVVPAFRLIYKLLVLNFSDR